MKAPLRRCSRRHEPRLSARSLPRLSLVGCLVALAAGSLGCNDHPAHTAPDSPTASGAFVERSGTHLTLRGRRYRFTGINIYDANSSGQCYYALSSGPGLDNSLRLIGGRHPVLRAWFYQPFAAPNASNWHPFDHTLRVARRHGWKVIATLGDQWGGCDSGGFKTEAWYAGGYRRPDPTERLSYRDWVAHVVRRYRNDPTILAWQLMNEAEDKPAPDAPCGPTAPAILRAFAADTSGLVKAIDPHHLVSLGTRGDGNCGTEGAAYQFVHSVKTIDLCEYHDYSPPRVAMSGDQRNGLAVRIAQCRALNKPLFVGESGINATAAGGSVRRAADFQARLSVQFRAGIAGLLAWDWDVGGNTDTYGITPGDPTLDVLARFGG